MTTQILNCNQSDIDLDRIYLELNSWWYLRSPEYLEAFVHPLANRINDQQLGCLDVACGEGGLARYVKGKYLGFDASTVAINTAIHYAQPQCKFQVGRIESFTTDEVFDSVVFGNIFSVTIRNSCHLDVISRFTTMAGSLRFYIYELEEFDTSHIDCEYKKTWEHHASVDLAGYNMVEVKRHRKVLEYRCN